MSKLAEQWFAAGLLATYMGCGGPDPKPTPTPTPTPTPVVEPTPLPSDPCPKMSYELEDTTSGGLLIGEVRAAQQEIGDVCGLDPELSLCELAGVLRNKGYEAYFGTDAVWIRRQDHLWEEHHAVFYGNGCWLSNTWYGTFREK